jgi:hypothetical protein
MKVFVSPNFETDKLDNPTFDDIVDVFKDRMMYWLFEPAQKLLKERNGYLGAFSLMLSYFEGIWSYVTGKDSKGKSKKFFKEAFVDVFHSSRKSEQLLERVSDILYEDGRCGFFHDTMLKRRVYIAELKRGDMLVTLPRNKDGTINKEGTIKSLIIDPRKFTAAVERHFVGYLLSLRNPDETLKRDNFLKIAKEKWDWEGDGTIIGINSDGTY